MSISMALFSPPTYHHHHHSLLLPKPNFTHKPTFLLRPTKPFSLLPTFKASTGDDAAGDVPAEEPKIAAAKEGNGTTAPAVPVDGEEEEKVEVAKFVDPRWIGGTWDLKQFMKDGKTDWDAVIDAEARRRKWLENNPESSGNDGPVLFDTSIVPWWAWMKRFHLPEAELLNGRAAMIGFFMAYLVDGLTGVGLVDQMSNFFCKTLLFVAVVGVLLIRKNEDIENLKRLLDEITFYDKQWQAAWQDETPGSTKNE